MLKRQQATPGVIVMLLLWIPLWANLSLFSSSEPEPALKALEKKLASAPDHEKLRLYEEFVKEYAGTLPVESLEVAREAMNMTESVDNPVYRFRALKLTGNWHYVNGRYKGAIELYLKALELEPRVENKELAADVLSNIGMVYWKLGDYDAAWEYHTRALEIRKSHGKSKKLLAHTLLNLGLVAEARKNLTKAMDYYRQAMALYKEENDKRGTAAAFTNISNVYATSKDHINALRYYKKAVAIYKEIGLTYWEANINWRIGKLHMLMNRPKEGEASFKEALTLAGKAKADVLQKDIYADLSTVYEAAGDFENAYKYHDQLTALKYSILKKENSEQLTLLQIRHRAEAKENELSLLRETNENLWITRGFLIIAALLSLGVVMVLYGRFRARKRADRLLSLNENKYRALFSYAGDAIFLVSSGRITDCNEKAAAVFNIPREELIGSTTPDFTPPDREALEEETLKEIERRKSLRYEKTFVRKDGSTFDAAVNLAVTTIDGLAQVQAIVRDITEHKLLDEERVKTAKLETTGLIAGGISRDFDNILANMQDILECTGKDAGDTGKIETYLERVNTAVSAAAALSRTFRLISRESLEPKKSIDIGAITREAVLPVIGKPGTGCRYRFDIPPGLPLLECRPKQIRRVLLKLTRNALEAMEAGDKTGLLTVTAAEVRLKENEIPPLAPGRYIMIALEDNGKGIPPGDLPKIFDPYFSTRSEYSRKGLGLGLTISQAIIKRHNGAIHITSQLGKGTVCRVYLPAPGES